MKRVVLPVILMLIVLIGGMPNRNVRAHTGALHNCTEKKDVVAWGAWAYINWTNPDLDTGDGGQWVYNRVGVAQVSPWRFVEFGWWKTTSGLQGYIAYNDGSGNKGQSVTISAATHRYSMQYDPNTGKYWFYVDGSNVWNVNANFTDGDFAVGGGEVGYGVESMGHTKLWDLRYSKRNPDGTFQYALWNGHVNYADDDPYFNTNIDSNSFYDDGDGHN